MGEPATKDDVRQIMQEEHRKLREDVIEPIKRQQHLLLREVYGETMENGLKGKVNAIWRFGKWAGAIMGSVCAAGLIYFFGFL